MEERPGTLVDHIGIDAFGPQKRDTAFPVGALRSERAKLDAQKSDLLVKFLLGPEAMVARVRVDGEITDHHRSDDVEREGFEGSARPVADHHCCNMIDPP